MIQITIDVPKALWLSANQRMHWARKAKVTKRLRAKGNVAVVKAGRPKLTSAHIVAHVAYPTNRRADVANSYPTLKALIDGMVDAGLLPDDDNQHLTGPDMRLAPKTGKPGIYRITFDITEKGQTND